MIQSSQSGEKSNQSKLPLLVYKDAEDEDMHDEELEDEEVDEEEDEEIREIDIKTKRQRVESEDESMEEAKMEDSQDEEIDSELYGQESDLAKLASSDEDMAGSDIDSDEQEQQIIQISKATPKSSAKKTPK